MVHLGNSRLLVKICAALLVASMCLCLAAGCSDGGHGGPVETQTPAQTPEPAPADTPEPDEGCDALFYGDSITAGNNFDEFFPQLRVVDLGINGATIEDLTERVPEVSAHHPAKIFVMAGGNNLYSGNVEECVELFRGLLDALGEACPYAEIFVESMLPFDKAVAARFDCPNRVVRGYNERLQELAEEYGMPYLDIYPAYEYHGGLNSDMTEDGIHLKYDCYGPWAEILRPYLEP